MSQQHEIIVDKAKGEITLTMRIDQPLAPETSLAVMGAFLSARSEAYEAHLQELKLAPPPKHIKEQTEDGVNRFVPEEWIDWYTQLHPGLGSRTSAIKEAVNAAIYDEFGTSKIPADHRINVPHPEMSNPEIVLERMYTERR